MEIGQPATPGLRERGKARRREAILDAALRLLRTHEVDAVSIEQIAAAAEVAPATVYNLVGTREDLLMALVDRVIVDLVEALAGDGGPDDPIEAAQLIVDRSVAAFVADPKAYRSIVGSLRVMAQANARMAFDPALLQVAAMREAQDRRLLRADIDPAALGQQILLSYNGALLEWAAGSLDDDGFAIAARHGLFTALAAAASDRHRRRFVERLVALGPDLTAAIERSRP